MPMQIYGDVNGNGIQGAGSTLEFIESNGNIDVTLAANAAWRLLDSSGNVLSKVDASSRPMRVAKVALVAAAGGGGVISWQNPEGAAIIINRIETDVTTVATGACTIDIGTTATSATTSSDTLIDGLDVNAAAGVFDNITDKGTNGKSRQKLASGKWITGTVASGTVTGLVGSVYIHYHLA